MISINSSGEEDLRAYIADAQRIVIKIGSRVLVTRTGRPDLERIKHLVSEIARLRKAGKEVVVVSSGAIAAGVEALGLKTRPKTLPELQMAAAVGQVRLMTVYDKLFAREGCRIGQVLLTHADLQNRSRHLNGRNTMMTLLREGIIPIINENDVVAVDEIKFGDNDILASLVTILIDGDLLMLLSTTDGLQAPGEGGKSRRVSYLPSVTEESLSLAIGKGSEFSSGGMASKLRSAQMAVDVGAMVVIVDGRETGTIRNVVAGKDIGTLIAPPGSGQMSSLSRRKRWIAFFHRSHGSITIDEGAQKAIEKLGRSLLPIGVREVEGEFAKGALVNIRSLDGSLIGRGLVGYSSEDIKKIKGKKSTELTGIPGSGDYEEVIHRDNMVVLTGKGR